MDMFGTPHGLLPVRIKEGSFVDPQTRFPVREGGARNLTYPLRDLKAAGNNGALFVRACTWGEGDKVIVLMGSNEVLVPAELITR